MARYRFAAERRIDAPAAAVYAILADYRTELVRVDDYAAGRLNRPQGVAEMGGKPYVEG